MKKKLTLSSPVFSKNDKIPLTYTCDGKNINPPLNISGVPKKARSLVLIMEDSDVSRDVKSNGVWDHWVLFNIPTTTRVIEEGEEPDGLTGVGTNGNTSYDGPCPPDKEHRYVFTLYALDTILDLHEGVSRYRLEKEMKDHIMDTAKLVGVYERVKVFK